MDSVVKYGQEIGPNLIKLAKKLIENQDLCRLLVNTDLEPLNKETHPEHINGISLLHKNIKVVPFIDSEEQTNQSKICLLFDHSEIAYNSDNENLSLAINIYCPFNTWTIAGNTLRPFAIMAEIRKSLQDKRINGLGEIKYNGFHLTTISDDMGAYTMRFAINAFS